MDEVYLSFAAEDAAAAEWIAETIEDAALFPLWPELASGPWDRRIGRLAAAPESVRVEVDAARERARRMIVVASPAYLQSAEAPEATRFSGTMIIVLVRDARLPIAWRGRRVIDLTGVDEAVARGRLLAALTPSPEAAAAAEREIAALYAEAETPRLAPPFAPAPAADAARLARWRAAETLAARSAPLLFAALLSALAAATLGPPPLLGPAQAAGAAIGMAWSAEPTVWRALALLALAMVVAAAAAAYRAARRFPNQAEQSAADLAMALRLDDRAAPLRRDARAAAQIMVDAAFPAQTPSGRAGAGPPAAWSAGAAHAAFAAAAMAPLLYAILLFALLDVAPLFGAAPFAAPTGGLERAVAPAATIVAILLRYAMRRATAAGRATRRFAYLAAHLVLGVGVIFFTTDDLAFLGVVAPAVLMPERPDDGALARLGVFSAAFAALVWVILSTVMLFVVALPLSLVIAILVAVVGVRAARWAVETAPEGAWRNTLYAAMLTMAALAVAPLASAHTPGVALITVAAIAGPALFFAIGLARWRWRAATTGRAVGAAALEIIAAAAATALLSVALIAALPEPEALRALFRTEPDAAFFGHLWLLPVLLAPIAPALWRFGVVGLGIALLAAAPWSWRVRLGRSLWRARRGSLEAGRQIARVGAGVAALGAAALLALIAAAIAAWIVAAAEPLGAVVAAL